MQLYPERSIVPEMLQEYGTATRNALSAYLPDQEPRRYLYDLIADYPSRGGKMMRPSLCIATARALGASIEEAINCAVSIELLHNALLIHDDIEDESEERRGKPTMHVTHGIAHAINAGDMLGLLSMRPLVDNYELLGPETTQYILQEADSVARESAEGQALELGWRDDNRIDITQDDYLLMVLKKTCWLAAIYPCRLGAIVGSGRPLPPDEFVRFGFFLGAAFQIQDDVLNLLADSRYGKERDGDLWEGKRTLMIIHLLRHCSNDEKLRIKQLLALPRAEKPESEVQWLRQRIDEEGSIKYAQLTAHGLAGAALAEFDQIFRNIPPSRDARFIRELVTWIFERQEGKPR